MSQARDGLTRTNTSATDLAGTRNQNTVVGRGNRLLADGTDRPDTVATYSYDAEGNVSRIRSAAGQWLFGYDHANHLVSHVYVSPSRVVEQRVRYGYDAFGQAVEERNPGSTYPVMYYAFAGGQVWAYVVENTLVQMRFLRGDHGEVFARIDPTDGALWYLTDRQGSVLQIITPNGIRWKHVSYQGFNVWETWHRTEGWYDPFGYQGKETDQYWGGSLVYDQGRWYHPQSGRWLTEDPRGLEVDTNPYRFEHNQPTRVETQRLTESFSGKDKGTPPTWWESLIPVYGSARNADYHFQNDRWGWGLAYSVLAVTDIIPARALFNLASQGLRGLGKLAFREAAKEVGKLAAVQTSKAVVGFGHGYVETRLLHGRSHAEAWQAGAARGLGGLLDPTWGTYFRAGGAAVGGSVGYVTSGWGGAQALAAVGDVLGNWGGLFHAGLTSAGPCGCRSPLGSGLWAAAPSVAGGTLGFAGGLLSYAQSGNPWDIVQGVHVGDALLSRLAPLSGWYQRLRPCFPGDMAVRTRTGWRRWDEVTAGEEVATCDEHDPHGPIECRPIEELFVADAPIWEVVLAGGEVLRTTAEHPVYVWERGWIAAHELRPGDRLRRDDGQTAAVREVDDTGKWERVYNGRVAEYHTYFVGKENWGFGVWAHNACTGFESIENHLEGEARSLRLGRTRQDRAQIAKQLRADLADLPHDAEIVYALRDRRSGEILTTGKTSKGLNSVNMTTRVNKYGRQEEFLATHGYADVELVMDYAVIKPQSVKQFQSLGVQVESGVEAPLRSRLSKDWGLLWDNTKERLEFGGSKWVSENPTLRQNWLNKRTGWLWRGEGI